MRKAEREIKDQGELEDVIRRAEVCRLAMVDDGEPYIVPMNFGFRKGTFYFHCAKEGRKLEVLRKAPRVCFELEAGVQLVRGEKACQ
ncbi:MAG TPA: pyridoxamine 5'-phosphate oxidase family protein, partial [Methanomassiliicoccales archaeon]|nr:pyridoxamine 5'-phosphate oxidase family protein [Methanomassiliicoccales archaeon]